MWFISALTLISKIPCNLSVAFWKSLPVLFDFNFFSPCLFVICQKMSVWHFYVTVTSYNPFISFLHLSLFHHRCHFSPHLCLAVCLLPNPPTGFSGLAAFYISPVKALVPQMPKLLKSLFPVRDDKKDLRPSPHSQQVWSCFHVITF